MAAAAAAAAAAEWRLSAVSRRELSQDSVMVEGTQRRKAS